MRECLARAVPSGLSGHVRAENNYTGQYEALILKALRGSVRCVRDNLYCLTCARARVAVKRILEVVCKNGLIYSFFLGQTGQKKEAAEIVKKKLVRSLVKLTGQDRTDRTRSAR